MINLPVINTRVTIRYLKYQTEQSAGVDLCAFLSSEDLSIKTE